MNLAQAQARAREYKETFARALREGEMKNLGEEERLLHQCLEIRREMVSSNPPFDPEELLEQMTANLTEPQS